MSKLFTHAARQRELDAIAALPPERQEEKFARLDAVRRINQRDCHWGYIHSGICHIAFSCYQDNFIFSIRRQELVVCFLVWVI